LEIASGLYKQKELVTDYHDCDNQLRALGPGIPFRPSLETDIIQLSFLLYTKNKMQANVLSVNNGLKIGVRQNLPLFDILFLKRYTLIEV